jgi:shikimate kinase
MNNIMLTGFMGSGKTTVGRILAKKMNWRFLDADQEIERRHGMPISAIFQKMGEPKFRQFEREFMLEICHGNSRSIVSLGGGAFVQDEIRQACLSTSFVVFLELSWESWQARQHLLIDTRPLLKTKSPGEIRSLFESRQRIYALSHLTVRTDNLSPEDVADRIADAYAAITKRT